MKPHALILLLLSLLGANVSAQTPYDAFAPETSRPMFVLDEITTREGSSQCNVINDSIWSTKSSADDISKWLSVDPLSDKYPSVSPYAYCHWSPLNYVDNDGRDDLFDESGMYLKHVDNGTDFVMIQKSNGKQQNITEFSYKENDIANREMLNNVATYYAHQVGLNQMLDNCDVEREGAMALTDILSDFHQVYMSVVNGQINSDANTSNNIMNALVHENDHVIKGKRGHIAEVEAIVNAISHPSWVHTTDRYKQATMQYLVDNANRAPLSVYSTIEPIMNRLEKSGLILNYNQSNNTYSWSVLVPDIMVINH